MNIKIRVREAMRRVSRRTATALIAVIAVGLMSFGLVWSTASMDEVQTAQRSTDPDRTYWGKVAVPDPSNPWVGYDETDEECWVRVDRINPTSIVVESSFWEGQRQGSVMSGADFFLGELANDQAFVLQLFEGHPVALTHTSYDENGDLNYGISGTGDMNYECMRIQTGIPGYGG